MAQSFTGGSQGFSALCRMSAEETRVSEDSDVDEACGYTEPHTRRGYASEAARACLPYVFDTLGWDSVSHVIVEGNVGSIGVAKAIGSKLLRRVEDHASGRHRLIYGQDMP